MKSRIDEEIDCLEKSPLIIQYNKLLREREELEKVKTHKHIFVTTGFSNVSVYYDTHTCIKCGESFVLPKTIEEQITTLNLYKAAIWIDDIYCDESLAKGIYEGITKNYKDLSDEEIAHYFRVALYMMKKNEKSDMVQAKRLERLKTKSIYWYNIG